MVEYERGLGDLWFRGTKGRWLGQWLGFGETLTRRVGRSPRRQQHLEVVALGDRV